MSAADERDANGDAGDAAQDDGTSLSLHFDDDWSPPPPTRAPTGSGSDEPLTADPPYEHRPVPTAHGRRSFLADAFAYPLRGRGVSTIVIGTALLIGVQVLSWVPLLGIVVLVIGAAFGAAFYLDVVGETLSGREQVPDWPSPDEALVGALLRLLAVAVLSFGPVWLADLALDEESTAYRPVVLATSLWGAAYWPMGVLAVQVRGSFADALPHVVLPAIGRCLPHYLLAAGIFSAVLISMQFYEEWAGAVPLVGFVLAAATWVYAFLVKARVIGLIYREHRDGIGWADGLG